MATRAIAKTTTVFMSAQTTSNTKILLLALMAALMALGCSPKEKTKKRYASLDGGTFVPRKECNKPSFECYDKCARRDASDTCSGCCFDQRRLCDTLQQYSFEYCDSAQ